MKATIPAVQVNVIFINTPRLVLTVVGHNFRQLFPPPSILDADSPLSCHDPHFKWRRARRKAIPEHDNQCPLVKSRNIAELQHLAMTRRVGIGLSTGAPEGIRTSDLCLRRGL
jgi:hypothetical protein